MITEIYSNSRIKDKWDSRENIIPTLTNCWSVGRKAYTNDNDIAVVLPAIARYHTSSGVVKTPLGASVTPVLSAALVYLKREVKE